MSLENGCPDRGAPGHEHGDQHPPVAPAPLLTAEEFSTRPDPGHPEELVKGQIIRMPPPDRRHGQICSRVVHLLLRFLEDHDLGHVLSNDSGIITRRNPDTVRGADVAFYSYARLPKGDLPPGYGPEAPELVVKVLSPGDRWADVVLKVGEYLSAGVLYVVVLDDSHRSDHVFRPDAPPLPLGPDESLSFPEILPGFEAKVGAVFG